MLTTPLSWTVLSIIVPCIVACDGRPGQHTQISDHPSQIARDASFSSPDDALRLAAGLQGSGASDAALAVLAEAHKRYPGSQPVLSAYGRQALEVGERALAARLLAQALEVDPGDWRALSAKAVLDGREGRWSGARLSLMRARTLSEDNAAILNNLGMSYLLEGNVSDAATLFRKALSVTDLKPRYASRIKRNLAVALAVKGDFTNADRLAGERMPRTLKNARADTIINFMGITDRRRPDPSGWTARLADASEVFADALR